MSFAPGQRLDHYEIVERIGVGGMGEVFRARDTRLPREVAIKVSTMAFNERFAREAKVIASLNHPNICTLFDVGANYLVMELVEGDTLQDRIKQGPLSLDEASRIARQIAEALDYAHDHGIIHRDLKPANIKVRPDGVVKVLDFGLAKAMQTTANPDEMATVTMGATQAGAVMGTPNYMSPEQATGRPTDKRADTWAFGIVFYEMLAGGKPFSGATVQESIASTLRDAPDLGKVPAQVRRLLRRCLEKDPANRLKHLGDVMSLVDEAPSMELSAAAVSAATSQMRAQRATWLWPAVAAIGVMAAAAIAVMHFTEKPAPVESVRFSFDLPPGATLSRTGVFSISPDGRNIVFAATDGQGSRWWIRRMDSADARPLELQSGVIPFPPFWSPDSRFIGYMDGDKVMKAAIAGGAPQMLCEKCQALGGAWGKDGTILLGNLTDISRISENGGALTQLTEARRSNQGGSLLPVLLPDGKHFLYLLSQGGVTGKIGVRVGSVDLKPEQQSKDWLLETQAGVAWVPPSGAGPGQLLYMNGALLLARTFDAGKLAFSGEAVPVANQVAYLQNFGWGSFAASANGHLVYRAAAQVNKQQLTWIDRTGKVLGTVGDPGQFSVVVLSPDGKRAALSINNGTTEDVWVGELAAGTRTRLTFEPGVESNPVWTKDGANIIYSSTREGKWGIYRRAANGVAGEEKVYQFPAGTGPPNLSDVSPDGKLLVFHQGGGAGGTDIWSLELTRPGAQPKPLLQTQFADVAARFSPDGRWYIYRNNESGRNEIYVQAVPGYGAPAGKWLVSRDGGIGMARWRRDGREVFFLSLDGAVMAADVTPSPTFQSGAPKKLFDVPSAFKVFFAGGVPGSLVDMTPDGQRFLFAVPMADSASSPFQVVTNWQAGLAK